MSFNVRVYILSLIAWLYNTINLVLDVAFQNHFFDVVNMDHNFIFPNFSFKLQQKIDNNPMEIPKRICLNYRFPIGYKSPTAYIHSWYYFLLGLTWGMVFRPLTGVTVDQFIVAH